jgi:hypothetical protein
VRPVGLVLLLLIFALAGSLFATDYDSAVEKKMFELVNQERRSRGLSELRWNDKLRDSARKHTDALVEHKFLSHQFVGEPNVQTRIAATGLHFSASAENLASSTSNTPTDAAQELHDALMHSAGHRANILNVKMTAIGIGVRHEGESHYATQNFAVLTEDHSDDDAEKVLIDTLNAERKRLKMPALRFTASRAMREALCQQAEKDMLSARALFVDEGYHGVSAVTTANLGEVPKGLERVIAEPGLTKMAIGVCFRVTEKYPGGMYWLGFEY